MPADLLRSGPKRGTAMDYTRREFLGSVSAAAAIGGVARAANAQVSDDPLGVRRDFPVVDEMTYLDSAYITPSPRQAIAATQSFIGAKARNPVSLGAMTRRRE